jgi:type IX secretion system PorP/SprF family membrane protein
MKKTAAAFCFALASHFVSAQQEAPISHTVYSYSFYNPAHTGSSKFGEASILNRQHNLGFKSFEGYNLTSSGWLATFGMPLKRFNSGIGINVYTHDYGLETKIKPKLNYSYQAKIGEGQLGLGLYAGFIQTNFDTDKLNPKDKEDDIYLKLKNESGFFSPDFGFGAHYQVGRSYLGLSTTGIAQTRFKYKSDENSKGLRHTARHFYMYGGYKYQTSNPMIRLSPSVFAQTSGAAATLITLNVMADYADLFYAGLAYSTSHNASFLFGVDLRNGSKLDGMRVGVSYDLILGQMRGHSNGSFELAAGYSFTLDVEKSTKKYKSVRFL